LTRAPGLTLASVFTSDKALAKMLQGLASRVSPSWLIGVRPKPMAMQRPSGRSLDRHLEIDFLAPGQRRGGRRQRRRDQTGGRRVEQLGVERERTEIEANARHGGGPRFHTIMRGTGSAAAGQDDV
jgi:hypothetical protein